MARRPILVALAAAFAVAWPAHSSAATAPPEAPVLTSTLYALPVTFTWTPGTSDPLNPNTSQTVYRDEGACTTPVTQGGVIKAFEGNATSSFVANPQIDNIYCYHIRTGDLLGGSADGPGLTVVVDTHNPTATVAVAEQPSGGTVAGIVAVNGTASDAVSGVGSTTFHVGAVGACPAGVVIPPRWDTTTVANGTYEVCNVVTDNVGHAQVATVKVTVANPTPLPLSASESGLSARPTSTPGAVAGHGADRIAPRPPANVTVVLTPAQTGARTVPFTLRWAKPKASDLDRVVVVLNLTRPPRSPADGRRVYHGLGASVVLRLAAGGTGYLALFAYDHTGNVSAAARTVVSLAPLLPLRPVTGSTVSSAPRLTWKATQDARYYNVQVFHKGTRVLTGWPTRAAFSIPPGRLRPGTYVWFVWPAIKAGSGPAAYGALIGRATFLYAVP